MKFAAVCCLMLACAHAYAEDVLFGIGQVDATSPRAGAAAVALAENINGLLAGTQGFASVNSTVLRQQLSRFACTDEQCMLRFAEDAGICLFITLSVADTGDALQVKIAGYGTKFPYHCRRVYGYNAIVPLTGTAGSGEYALVSEEHSARFVAGLLDVFVSPRLLDDKTVGIAQPIDDGDYTVYRRLPIGGEPAPAGKVAGSVTLRAGKATTAGKGYVPAAGDFILQNYKRRAASVAKVWYSRKHGIVFAKPDIASGIATALFIPLGSLAAPVAAPALGYVPAGDWAGLGLFALNAAPYYYLEIRGFVNNPYRLRDNHRTASRVDRASWCFAWYMAFAGGAGLFADAFASRYLSAAAAYAGVQQYMGSPFLAGYLALTTAGGGMFYRGQRFWGYVYFHANNLLVFAAIRDFLPAKYARSDGKYVRGRANRFRGGVLLGVLGAVKIGEVIHSVFASDAIANGDVTEEPLSVEPVVFGFWEQPDAICGLGVNFRF